MVPEPYEFDLRDAQGCSPARHLAARVGTAFDGNFTDAPSDIYVPAPGLRRMSQQALGVFGEMTRAGELGWIAFPPGSGARI